MNKVYIGVIIAAFALLLLGGVYAVYNLTTPDVPSQTTLNTGCGLGNASCTQDHSCCSSSCNKSLCTGQCGLGSSCGCSN